VNEAGKRKGGGFVDFKDSTRPRSALLIFKVVKSLQTKQNAVWVQPTKNTLPKRGRRRRFGFEK